MVRRCDAPIIAFTANQTLHYQPTYFALGHFSKFIPRRLGVRVLNNPRMEVTAFKTPPPLQRIVLVVINRCAFVPFVRPRISRVDAIACRSDYNTTFKLQLTSNPSQAALIPLFPHSFETLII